MRALGIRWFARRVLCCAAVGTLLLCSWPWHIAALADEPMPPVFSTVYPRFPTGSPSLDQRSTALACVKQLADGATVYVSNKIVTGVWLNHMYVEEADRSSGIKVIYAGYYPPADLRRGCVVSFWGELWTVDGECVLYARSPITCDDFEARSELGPVGLSSPAILGWALPPRLPNGPRVQGLLPIGIYTKIWGRVTATNLADDEGYYIYLSDGYNLLDRSEIGVPGIRVYSNARPALGAFLTATGVLGLKIVADPTPSGPNGDEIIAPVLRANYDQDPSNNIGDPVFPPVGLVSGRVRLVGQGAPGRPVRIYTQNGSVVLEGVTDDFQPFTLNGLTEAGNAVSATAAGYLTATRIAHMGDTNVDFELQPAERHIDVSSDRDSLPVCSSASALISALARDVEGKPLPGLSASLTTTKGVFVENGARSIVVNTDERGRAQVHLSAGPDGPGTADIVATAYPVPGSSGRIQIQLRGPDISLSASPYLFTEPGDSAIGVSVVSDGGPVGGASLTLTTDHGHFVESGTNVWVTSTNSQGSASATLRVESPGSAKVVAVYTDSCGHSMANWTWVAYRTSPWLNVPVTNSNPLIVDLDGQNGGTKEAVLVNQTGELMAVSSAGSVIWSRSTYSSGGNSPSCAVLDPGPNGRPCVFVPSETMPRVYGFSHDGKALAGWPVGTNHRFLGVAASIGDINRDGAFEIVSGDESCYVFGWNPTGDWKKSGTWESSFLWRNITAGPSISIIASTCALGDLDSDSDGILDVAVGGSYSLPLFAFPGDAWGDFAYDPLYTPGYPKPAGGPVQCSPAIGDIDGDGINDIAVGSNDQKLYMWLSGNNSWKGYPTGGIVKSSPALCDLDGDGKLEVIVGSESGRLFVFNWLGQFPEGWANGIKLNNSGVYPIQSSPVVGDVNGDGQVEIVVGCADGNIYALYKDGTVHRENGVATGPIAWIRCCIPPDKPSAQVNTAPVIDDINNDGKVDVLAAGTGGVYLFHFDAPYSGTQASYPWPTFHRDNRRSGCATPEPPPVNASIQGYVTKNGQPVPDARVYISYNDGSPVYIPHSDPPAARDYVLTVGTSDPNEARKGAYCINQLPPNSVYKLTVQSNGSPAKVVENISVGTGSVRVDIAL